MNGEFQKFPQERPILEKRELYQKIMQNSQRDRSGIAEVESPILDRKDLLHASPLGFRERLFGNAFLASDRAENAKD